jgi:hypothetical protein
VSAEINLSSARYHHWTALANPFADRRIDLYDGMLGYREPEGAAAARPESFVDAAAFEGVMQ